MATNNITYNLVNGSSITAIPSNETSATVGTYRYVTATPQYTVSTHALDPSLLRNDMVVDRHYEASAMGGGEWTFTFDANINEELFERYCCENKSVECKEFSDEEMKRLDELI